MEMVPLKLVVHGGWNCHVFLHELTARRWENTWWANSCQAASGQMRLSSFELDEPDLVISSESARVARAGYKGNLTPDREVCHCVGES